MFNPDVRQNTAPRHSRGHKPPGERTLIDRLPQCTHAHDTSWRVASRSPICGAQGGGRRAFERFVGSGAEGLGGVRAAHRARRARPCSRSASKKEAARRPRGARERRARPLLLPRTRDWHGRTKPGAVRAGRSATGGCSRAAALQYQPRRELGTLKVLLTATNGARTSDRTAGGQRDREGRRVMRAAPIFSRSAWSPLEPSVSALRRAGAPQPGIGSRSLLGRPGSWADPLQVDHWRRGPSVDGSAPPTRCVCDAWDDAFQTRLRGNA